MVAGRLLGDIHFPPISLESLNARIGVLKDEEAGDFVEFIQSTLNLEPKQRPDARELLQAGWLRDI